MQNFDISINFTSYIVEQEWLESGIYDAKIEILAEESSSDVPCIWTMRQTSITDADHENME